MRASTKTEIDRRLTGPTHTFANEYYNIPLAGVEPFVANLLKNRTTINLTMEPLSGTAISGIGVSILRT